MPIFESGQPLHTTIEITVLGHSFTLWPQQHPDEIKAVLTDMCKQGGINPITWPGPYGERLPDSGELIIKWRSAYNGEFFFGASTIAE